MRIRWPILCFYRDGWLGFYLGQSICDYGFAFQLSLVPQRALMRRDEQGREVLCGFRVDINWNRFSGLRARCRSDAREISNRLYEKGQSL